MSTMEREPRTIAFGPLRIAFDDHVLEPRDWTVEQGRWASQLAADAPDGPVLELCSGAGQIGLLAVHGSGRGLVAVDADAGACAWIRRNAETAGMSDLVEVRHEQLATACRPGELFPVIVADPPWVPHDEIDRFPRDPVLAIDGGPDGLDLARQCLQVIGGHLMEGGVALLQLGTTEQANRLERDLPAGLSIADLRSEPGRGVVIKLDTVIR